MLLTTTRLINLHAYKIKRSISLSKIQALTQCISPGDFNFLVHVEDDYDYGFICKQREELVQMIQKCYFDLQARELIIYGVTGSIVQYVTPKKGKFDIRKAKGLLPPDECRINFGKIKPSTDVYNNKLAR